MNSFDTLLTGQSPTLRTVVHAAQVIAATDVTTLILGESGTGKERLATALHQASRRAAAPLVTVNCAALPEALAEAELFGARKGAFTGAQHDREGRIGAADGGTLFLDEIGELPLAIQAKLLRFLESGECQPLGDHRPRRVDVRVIAATHRDLAADAAAGRFRADLYYRLNVVPLTLPPLRERREDIALLARRLSEELATRHGLSAPRFSRAALKRLEQHPWPGNVRELRNLCERLVILLGGRTIEPENLPLEIAAPEAATGQRGFALPEEGIRLEELEAEMIRQALARTDGNRSRAARLLGLSRDTLLYRLKKYALA